MYFRKMPVWTTVPTRRIINTLHLLLPSNHACDQRSHLDPIHQLPKQPQNHYPYTSEDSCGTLPNASLSHDLSLRGYQMHTEFPFYQPPLLWSGLGITRIHQRQPNGI